MILTCPSCDATASACAWENDIVARGALKAIVGMPPPVAKAAMGYFSLFRPSSRALTWKKVSSLAAELMALVILGYVQVQGKPARNCPPQLWAAGMEQMVERSAALQRPLKNHNYLRQVVWQLAEQADARQEHQVRHDETTGATKSRVSTDDGMSEIMRKYLAQNGGLHDAE